MIKGARSSAVVALLVVVAGLAIAACGSSSSSSASAAAGSSGAATSTTGTATTPGRRGGFFTSLTATQRSCLKSKGVTLPTGGGHFGAGRFGGGSGTGTFTRPTGTPPAGGTFTRPSGGTFPGGTSTTGGGPGGPGAGGFRGGANASRFAAAFKACGVTFGGGFGARAGAGHLSATALKTFVACVDTHGYTLTDVNTSGTGAALPRSLETNRKFLAAAKSCEQDLRPSVPPGTTTTSSG